MFRLFVSAVEAAVEAAVTAAPTTAVSESKLAAMSIFSKGLFTTLLGLVGVFLVLTLFYVAIKLMQRKNSKSTQPKE